MAAAAAWDALADELYAMASGFSAVITDLTAAWLGPASVAMAAAAAPFISWITPTAALTEAMGMQVSAATAAYEAAFLMTVPPPVIAANRSLLALLVATNWFGQNTPAIMATEAHYMAMWAQDATAMYGYLVAAVAATTYTLFTDPPEATTAAALTAATDAAAQAAETPAGTVAQTVNSALTTSLSTVVSSPLSSLLSGPMGSVISSEQFDDVRPAGFGDVWPAGFDVFSADHGDWVKRCVRTRHGDNDYVVIIVLVGIVDRLAPGIGLGYQPFGHRDVGADVNVGPVVDGLLEFIHAIYEPGGRRLRQ